MPGFLKLFLAPPPSPSALKRPRGFRPQLETLEERVALATDVWTDATLDGKFGTANNWSLFRVPTDANQDTAFFGPPTPRMPNAGKDCTVTGNYTIFGLSLAANWPNGAGTGHLILNGGTLTMDGPNQNQSNIDNAGGVVFTNTSDELIFQKGTEELSSTGGFSGAQGAVVIDQGSQFTIQNTALSQSTANFFVGDTNPGTGSLVMNNTKTFSLMGGAYIYISSGGTLSFATTLTVSLIVLDGGNTGSYIDNYGQVTSQNSGLTFKYQVNVPLIDHNGSTLFVSNSDLDFETSNANSNNVSIWQRGGVANLANSAVLEATAGYLQDSGIPGGTLQTNDATACTFRSVAGDVVINGGFVKLDVNGAAGTFGSLTIDTTLVFNGGEYDPRISGPNGGSNDQITADSITINGGKLVVTVIGALGGGSWNILVNNAGPIANKFPNETLNGTASTLTPGKPGFYQLKKAGGAPVSHYSLASMLASAGAGAALDPILLDRPWPDAWAIIEASRSHHSTSLTPVYWWADM
jgi:hypothetical protein